MDPLWLVLLTSSIPSPRPRRNSVAIRWKRISNGRLDWLDRSKMTTHLGHEQIDFTAMHGMEF